MEKIITSFIYIHAFFGGLGLISGLAILFIQKGSAQHKRLGKIFSGSMIISSLISIPICFLPNHKNLFLALIGIFTVYLIVTGNRALHFKRTLAQKTDYWISYMMMGISVVMLVIGIIGLIQQHYGNVLFLFFGILGFRLAFSDLNLYKNRNLWLSSHVGKMLGALIASITAFIVAGLQLNHYGLQVHRFGLTTESRLVSLFNDKVICIV